MQTNQRDTTTTPDIAANDAAQPAINRRALYLGSGDEALFAWHHHAPRAIPRDCVAVLCGPIGPEYTRSHRTVRHLADRLAAAGIPAIRFDYQGCGDSAGDEASPDRLGAWRRSIAAAAWHARRLSGCSRVCLIGIRLGATLAALEAEEVGADLLVLWNPVVKGRAYTRELQAIAMTAAEGSAQADGLESAGFSISPETLAALKAIDLTQTRYKARARVLVAGRDDMAFDASLAAHLSRSGVDHDVVTLSGWNGMMADHQWTVVPETALAAIVEWLHSHTLARPAMKAPTTPNAEAMMLGGLRETLCRFGADAHLFGVLTEPRQARDVPAVILLNAGSIHHVGPSRLYVRLARGLAEDGFPCLRLDHEGIGDSVLRQPGVENEPYAASAMQDLQSAIDLLKARGHRRFVVMGLCSGAHTAFHAARQFEGEPIECALLVNPWYFYWSAGMTYDPNCHHFENVVAVQRSMRSPDRWKRLLRGEVDFSRVTGMAATLVAQMARKATWFGREMAEIVAPSAGSQLSRDFRKIFAHGRTVWLYEADAEPAGAVAMTEARRTYHRARREGRLVHERIVGGDHTFTQSAARAELIRRLRDAFKRTWKPEAPQ
jgi:alpha-beta hydrolase superfamily lysophospholipase